MPEENPHVLAGRRAAYVSWANTVDRTARTAPARRAGPGNIEWHLARLPKKFDNATDEQRYAAAEAAKKAYFAGLIARRWKQERNRRTADETPTGDTWDHLTSLDGPGGTPDAA